MRNRARALGQPKAMTFAEGFGRIVLAGRRGADPWSGYRRRESSLARRVARRPSVAVRRPACGGGF